ncbi:MAG TPA: Ig-like domain-containing protein [Actinomycetes bacterium]|nr:Ig-like domain-containing protein [Actinomycetes bacterium]
MDKQHIRPQRAITALSGALVAATLSACMSAGADDRNGLPGDAPTSAATISVRADGSNSWDPSRPVVIASQDGTLTDVQVRDRQGHKVAGDVSSDGTAWRTEGGLLKYNTGYTVRARAVDVDGLATRQSFRFRTVDPKTMVYSSITPFSRQVVGVGMPIIVSFDAPVPNRAAAERKLSVSTSPQTVGAWYWVSDQMVRWRPKEYWRPDTDVVVKSKLAGVNLGNGTWGNDDDRVAFTVGSEMISTVDIAKHMMVVKRGNEVLRRIPVTTGKPGWDTRVGTKVIMSKSRNVVMDAASIDVDPSDPEYYRLDVEYAMRVTWSGEYLHAAPWSESSQGEENVSHGCTGMSLANAAWFYNESKVGDVVNFINGTRQMEPWNGYTDWTMSWHQWKQGSALS